MHLSNETEMNQCPKTKRRLLDPSAPKNCSTSSTDSGVILNDNAAAFRPEKEKKKETKDGGSDGGQFQSKSDVKTEHKRISIEHTVNITKENAEKSSSPTVSIRSTTISIVSIDENAIDSSCIDSDSEADDAEDYTVQKLGQQVTYPPNSSHLRDLNQGLTVISHQVGPGQAAVLPPNPMEAGVVAKQILNGSLAVATPTPPPGGAAQGIGSIALTNSTDVTFGDKHFYEGPVTIQQFLIDNRDKWKAGEGPGGGQDNPAFNGGATVNGSAASSKLDNPAQTPPLCPFLPNTIGRKAVTITVVFVLLTTLLGIVLATTTNLFGKTLNQNLDNIGGGLILRFVERQQWLAQPPQKTVPDLQQPVKMVIVLPTNSDNCTTQAQCVFRVRLRQSFDIESVQEDDIVFNFLIGGDGNVYVGRGWDQVGAHMPGYNSKSLSLAYIGSFQTLKPSDKQLSVTRLLLAKGVKLGKLDPNYRLTAASKLEPSLTQYKADALYQSFGNWTHWS
ncbi:peptidoglycan-recognition protein LC isoform X4 [Drosophila elegans]|uniref:peptidoglycan-recognition protein LC isoform X4 n=1 Tax=Drosophila elegans TaxID=30023 RepID=UPI0007E71B67|nr:peptidoglycan-recognition protein LC isoform X4 [Drosophila elegans]